MKKIGEEMEIFKRKELADLTPATEIIERSVDAETEVKDEKQKTKRPLKKKKAVEDDDDENFLKVEDIDERIKALNEELKAVRRERNIALAQAEERQRKEQRQRDRWVGEYIRTQRPNEYEKIKSELAFEDFIKDANVRKLFGLDPLPAPVKDGL